MRSMRDRYELTCDGPYVRVVLPDVLPPDWNALEREIDEEVEDGATKVMVMAADERTLDTHVERLSALVSQLRADGIDTVVVWQDDPVVVA
jgi:hypothetical protein